MKENKFLIGRRKVLSKSCPECGSDMLLQDGKYNPFYSCIRYPDCLGCKQIRNDGSFMGKAARDDRTVKARDKAHKAFDKLWKGNDPRFTRSDSYKYLATLMGLKDDDAHIGNFTTEQCNHLINKLKNRSKKQYKQKIEEKKKFKSKFRREKYINY